MYDQTVFKVSDAEHYAVRDDVVRALRAGLANPAQPKRRKGDGTRKQEKARRRRLVQAHTQRSPLTARDWVLFHQQRSNDMEPRVSAAKAMATEFKDQYVIYATDVQLQPGDAWPRVMSTDLGNGKFLCHWPNPQIPNSGSYRQLFGTVKVSVLPDALRMPKEKA